LDIIPNVPVQIAATLPLDWTNLVVESPGRAVYRPVEAGLDRCRQSRALANSSLVGTTNTAINELSVESRRALGGLPVSLLVDLDAQPVEGLERVEALLASSAEKTQVQTAISQLSLS
jgi:hypothetical protein